MAGREKGSATAPCPGCGKDMPMEKQADGGLAAKECTTCFPAAHEKEKAHAATPAREHGTQDADVEIVEA